MIIKAARVTLYGWRITLQSGDVQKSFNFEFDDLTTGDLGREVLGTVEVHEEGLEWPSEGRSVKLATMLEKWKTRTGSPLTLGTPSPGSVSV